MIRVSKLADADRLGVAKWDASSGLWQIYSGNEIGALLSWWENDRVDVKAKSIREGCLQWEKRLVNEQLERVKAYL